VVAVALASGLLVPVLALLVVVPGLVSALRGPARGGPPYVIALALNVVIVAVSVVQTQITPA
jgi:hypothetical protein